MNEPTSGPPPSALPSGRARLIGLIDDQLKVIRQARQLAAECRSKAEAMRTTPISGGLKWWHQLPGDLGTLGAPARQEIYEGFRQKALDLDHSIQSLARLLGGKPGYIDVPRPMPTGGLASDVLTDVATSLPGLADVFATVAEVWVTQALYGDAMRLKQRLPELENALDKLDRNLVARAETLKRQRAALH